MGYIYCITNLANGKRYVGQTINYYKQRWSKHISLMEKKNGCPALKSAMLKYGMDRFKFEVIIICFDEDLDRIETEYIAKYGTMVPNGYNISPGGAASYGFQGKTHSEESREKMSIATRAQFATVEARAMSSA